MFRPEDDLEMKRSLGRITHPPRGRSLSLFPRNLSMTAVDVARSDGVVTQSEACERCMLVLRSRFTYRIGIQYLPPAGQNISAVSCRRRTFVQHA